MKISEKEGREIFSRCERSLNHHHNRRPREILAELAERVGREERADFYGAGNLIEDFEREVAALLGKEDAVFMPSGTMAQPIALRVWAEKAGNKEFGLHPTSHLENYEAHAYRHLHGLHGQLLGKKEEIFRPKDLREGGSHLASVILELPYRDLGGVLPPWDELAEMSAWCGQNGIRFHLDGARLWESLPFYGKKPAEICGLFDSAYVSFYKGLGGIAGAALAGPNWFVDEARVWQRRQGGNLISLYPYVVSAREALKLRLPRMRSYWDRAVEIAVALSKIPEIEIVPARPQVNMMHLILSVDLGKLEEAFLEVAWETKAALFRKVERLESGKGRLELTVGDATMDFSVREVAELMRECIDRAKK